MIGVRQFMLVFRHAKDPLDERWKVANADPAVLGVPSPRPEKDLPAIPSALEEFKWVAKAISDDGQIAPLLKNTPLSVFSSTKLRARQSTDALRESLLECYRTLTIEGTRFFAELDGRNYGFTWHRTIAGLHEIKGEKERYEAEGEYLFCPWGGESWEEVAARVSVFVRGVVKPSRRNMILMTHHELFPFVQDLLLGLVPGPLTIDRWRHKHVENATAVIYVRELFDDLGFGIWRHFKTITGRQGRDYSRDPEVLRWCTNPDSPAQVINLDEIRNRRRA